MNTADAAGIIAALTAIAMAIPWLLIRALRAAFDQSVTERPEPWGSSDYAPEKYIPLGELYRRRAADELPVTAEIGADRE